MKNRKLHEEKTVEDFEVDIFNQEDDNEDNFATCVWRAFDDSYETDDEKVERKFRHIFKSYTNADEAGKKLIDDTLISLCGYCLLTLLNQAEEIYNDRG